MPTIENRSNQLLIVGKNSGPAVYLGPGEAAVIPEFEIANNAKVEKLVKSGALKISEAATTEATTSAKKGKSQK